MVAFEQWSLVLDVIRTVVILSGFLIGLWQLRLLIRQNQNAVELSRRQQAMKLCARFTSPEFSARRLALRTDPEKQEDVYECAFILDFFEEVALTVKHGTGNAVLLEDAFAGTMRHWMEQDYMVEAIRHFHEQDPSLLENLIDVYRSWEAKRGAVLKINRIPDLK